MHWCTYWSTRATVAAFRRTALQYITLSCGVITERCLSGVALKAPSPRHTSPRRSPRYVECHITPSLSAVEALHTDERLMEKEPGECDASLCDAMRYDAVADRWKLHRLLAARQKNVGKNVPQNFKQISVGFRMSIARTNAPRSGR